MITFISCAQHTRTIATIDDNLIGAAPGICALLELARADGYAVYAYDGQARICADAEGPAGIYGQHVEPLTSSCLAY